MSHEDAYGLDLLVVPGVDAHSYDGEPHQQLTGRLLELLQLITSN